MCRWQGGIGSAAKNQALRVFFQMSKDFILSLEYVKSVYYHFSIQVKHIHNLIDKPFI